MRTVIPVVEGHGEVAATPVLLRRLAAWIAPHTHIIVGAPIRTSKSKFLNDELEFSRKLQLASLKAAGEGWVMLLLDADDDCPVELANGISARATKYVNTSNLSIVIAKREYEAWFIAAAESLVGCRSFVPIDDMRVADPDQPRDGKGWLARQKKDGYHEITDQPAFSAQMSLEQCWSRSRSFRHLAAEFSRHCNNTQ